MSEKSVTTMKRGRSLTRCKDKRVVAIGDKRFNAYSLPLELVRIPGGVLMMGSPADEPGRWESEGPPRAVTVPSFLMGRYPVTQAQWRAVAQMPKVRRPLDPDPSEFKGANRPVESVSWFEAVEFCDRLAEQTKRPYRLPSEAEWEYACRAGTTTAFGFGNTLTTEVANYDGRYTDGPNGDYRAATTPVNELGIANAFGLSEMHGNVWEWCEDPWHETYDGAPTDGRVWLGKSGWRIQRGALGLTSRSTAARRTATGILPTSEPLTLGFAWLSRLRLRSSRRRSR